MPVALPPLVRAGCTEQILNEIFRSLGRNRPDLNPLRVQRTRQLMTTAVRDCLVTEYEPLTDAVELPTPTTDTSPRPPSVRVPR